MALQLPLTIAGSPGSPYTRKMLAVLRYRRIPYRFVQASSPAGQALPQPRVRLLPMLYLPNDRGELEAVTDSSPLIRRLEQEAKGRSVIPDDPAIAFLDELIEDYADEWLTKAMFHYRWAYAADAKRAAEVLPCWAGFSVPDEVLAERGKVFAERQIGRLYVVGSNAVTGPVIEASYRRFLAAFDAHLTHQPFLLGERPGASDFGVFGQLSQLAQFDPTPMALTAEVAPRVYAWTSLMEDLSGLEPDEGLAWTRPDAVPDTLKALLAEIGRVYPPVMLANARALMSGEKEVRATVEGQPWTQQPFPYQAKCLQWLRASHGELPAPARASVDGLLADSGLAPLFG
ncbi:MAG TPA: glutathione S-transferase N-terminal domain-containing protein [Caulobacteraceae bacterium]|nr:glutathione S-transferase N-terminal domain-containing protein [Caulobacteraceae bacterium]